MHDGRIIAVGSEVPASPGARIIDAAGGYLTPGLVDVHSLLGDFAAQYTLQDAKVSDVNEESDPNSAEVWALHSIRVQDPQFSRVGAAGVTTLQVLPGSSDLFGGRGVVLKNVPAVTVSEGLQNALWELGKVPERHRTDRLSTAVNNTVRPAEFTERYAGLMRCYGLNAEKIQAGHGNENGDVEQRHHRFKQAVEQELLLRGSRDFVSLDAYRSFLQALFARLNAGRRQRLVVEMAVMRELPERRMESAKRERVKVDSGSLISVIPARERPLAVRTGAGVGDAGTADEVHQLRHAGAGSAGRQA